MTLPLLGCLRASCGGAPASRAPAPRSAALRLAPLLLALAVQGCAGMASVRPEPPRVSIASVRPLNLSLTRQRLEFRLRVQNPNDYDLPLRSLDFVARLAGERIASGRSDERVIIPADGEAIVKVDVAAGVGKLLGRVRRMLDERTVDLDYDVSGTVRLSNWPRAIPFDVEGVLENPRPPRETTGRDTDGRSAPPDAAPDPMRGAGSDAR